MPCREMLCPQHWLGCIACGWSCCLVEPNAPSSPRAQDRQFSSSLRARVPLNPCCAWTPAPTFLPWKRKDAKGEQWREQCISAKPDPLTRSFSDVGSLCFTALEEQHFMENSINTPVQPDICKQRLPNSIRLWAQSSIYRLQHGILYRKAKCRWMEQIPGK